MKMKNKKDRLVRPLPKLYFKVTFLCMKIRFEKSEFENIAKQWEIKGFWNKGSKVPLNSDLHWLRIMLQTLRLIVKFNQCIS